MKTILLTFTVTVLVGIFIPGCVESPRSVFLSEDVQHSIPLDQIYSGGPGKDGIPALTNPRVLTVSEGDGYLRDEDIVIGVEFDGESRAYPIRILNWHEIVNDTVGGMDVLITFCPLCGTGIVFNPRIDGVPRAFGVSGLLYNSDLLMYERGTEESSLWAQLLGEAVVGPLTGKKLKLLPSVQTTWEEWKARHPGTMVLDVNTGFSRNYGRDPYRGYDEESGTYFPTDNRDDRLFSKEWVYGITIGEVHKAYKIESLKARRIVNDSVGGVNLVLIADGNSGGVRAYHRGENVFSGSTTKLHNESESEWRVAEDALVHGETGERLERVEGVNSFWFGWVAFHPETELFQ